MAERPITFTGPEVRATLAGRKTMTRLIVSATNCEFGSIPAGKLTKLYWQHADWARAFADGFPDPQAGGRITQGYLHVPCHDQEEDSVCETCRHWGWDTTSHRLYPRTQPGDTLWVRETRKDARILLNVTGVKVERLQDISEEDAIAEGVCAFVESTDRPGSWEGVTKADDRAGLVQVLYGTNRKAFWHLWESLRGPGSWEANPWVVAVSFEIANPQSQGQGDG